MSLTLYWGSGSPVSWRAQLCLAFKGLAYESRRLDLGAKEHKSEWYLALNPRGTFPLLVDGEVKVRGSLAILSYLERKHPEPPLFGTTAEECGRIWECIDDHEDGLGDTVQLLCRAIFRPKGDRSPEYLQPLLDKAETQLAALEKALVGPYLLGDTVTAADLVHYPTLHRYLRAAVHERGEMVARQLERIRGDSPTLFAWLERVQTMPGVEDTYPPHWRSS